MWLAWLIRRLRHSSRFSFRSRDLALVRELDHVKGRRRTLTPKPRSAVEIDGVKGNIWGGLHARLDRALMWARHAVFLQS